MLGVGGAGGFGFFFLLEPRPEAVPTRLRWDFFFLVFRDSELLVPEEKGPREEGWAGSGEHRCPRTLGFSRAPRGRAQMCHLPRPQP